MTRHNPPSNLMSSCHALHTEEQIECGTSGGPVVTEDGELLGVVSAELMPVAHLTLPMWVLDKMVWTGPGDEEMDRYRRIVDERMNVSRRKKIG